VDTDVLANQLRQIPRAEVVGTWQRHVGARYKDAALDGYRAYGRWGTRNGFPVLYLGRPRDSIIVEAYRHLVDPVVVDDPAENLAQHLAPRVLVTCEVEVRNVVDLRTATARQTLHLSVGTLTSATNDEEAYGRCQEVAAAAHQIGFHGLITPAATGIDNAETLALFPHNLPDSQRPRLTSVEPWNELPRDPRQVAPRLRVVRDRDG
jgi:hypothetical protein